MFLFCYLLFLYRSYPIFYILHFPRGRRQQPFPSIITVYCLEFEDFDSTFETEQNGQGTKKINSAILNSGIS